MKQYRRWMAKWMAVVGVLWLLAGCGATQVQALEAGEAHELTLAGHIGGPALATVAYGDYALMGYSFEFAVVDVSNPADPVRVAYLMMPANDIAVSGSFAYVGGRTGLDIVDLTDPRRPQLLVSARLHDAATSVSIQGSSAYVTVRNGLYIVDASNPRQPQVQSWLQLPGRSEGVTAGESHAYIAGSAGLTVVDTGDASSPQIAATVSAIGYVEASALAGDLLYVAGGDNGLSIFDVSTPEQPAVLGQVDTPGYATGVSVAGGFAYVSDGAAGVQVVDVREPRAPALVHSLVGAQFVLDIAASDGFLFAVDRYQGLAIASLAADAANPEVIGRLQTPGFMGELAVHDGAAYVLSNPGSSVHVVDVSDQRSLRQLTSSQTLGSAANVTAYGDVIYIADGFGGLQVMDTQAHRLVSNTATAITFGDVEDVVVVGEHALLAGPGGIRVVDVSDPRNPISTECFCGNGETYRLAVEGNHVYAVGGEAVMQIIDMTDPAQPQLTAQVTLPGPAWDVAVLAGYAYVAGGENGLFVVDVHDPVNPALIQSSSAAGRADAVVTDGADVYVVNQQMGLCVYAQDGSHHLVERARFTTPDVAVSVAVADGTIYLTDRSGGLYLLHD
jgi:hypothetical protein